MQVLDRVKLAKVMNLTASDQAGESMAAAQRANAMLRKAGLGWDELLTGQPRAQGSWSRGDLSLAAVLTMPKDKQLALLVDIERVFARPDHPAGRWLAATASELADGRRERLARKQAVVVSEMARAVFAAGH